MYFEPNWENFKPNLSRAIENLDLMIKNALLGEYFDAFNDSILRLDNLERMFVHFKAGARLGNVFKVL